jgi:hypothetical protein
MMACNNKASNEQVSEEEGLQPVSYTLYTAKSELFVEF